MSTQDFIELLRKPETIANYSLDELRELSHKFSYSQPLQLLYAMRLKYSSQHLFDRQLGKTSILTNNRTVLFELFEETTPVPKPSEHINLEQYQQEKAPENLEVDAPGASAESVAEETEPPAPDEAPQRPAGTAHKTEAEQEATAPEEKHSAPEEQKQAQVEPAKEPDESQAQTADTEAEEQEARARPVEETPTEQAPGEAKAQESPAAEAEEKKEATEKPSPKSAMSERIREILEKNRRIREEALARKEGRTLPPKEDNTAQEKQTDQAPKEEASAEAESSSGQQPESTSQSQPQRPKAETDPETHSAEEPETTAEEDTLEGQSLVDEPQGEEAGQTTNDFVEENLPYQRQEGYEEKDKTVADEPVPEPESTLEEEVQQEEHQREPVEHTTSDFAEEDATAHEESGPEVEEEEQPKARAAGLSSLEERIAGIRSRLEKLGAEKEQEQPGDLEESDSGLADDLDKEYRDIQSRSEHLHDASFEWEESDEQPEQEEEYQPEEEFEPEGEFDPISDEEAQQMSFSRWLKQFEKKEAQLENKEEKTQAGADSDQLERDKASLKFEDKMQLLDSFVEKLPDLKKRKPLISNPPPKVNYEEVRGETEAEEDNSSSLVTETLAKVYIKQKHYKKAIQAYEILRLKYPEKSSLFADRISEIKKLENSK